MVYEYYLSLSLNPTRGVYDPNLAPPRTTRRNRPTHARSACSHLHSLTCLAPLLTTTGCDRMLAHLWICGSLLRHPETFRLPKRQPTERNLVRIYDELVRRRVIIIFSVAKYVH